MTTACTVCAEDFPSHEMLRLACKHFYCPACLTHMFKMAAEKETDYPPKCCKRISLTEARDFIERDTRKRYEVKRIEWETRNRVYCSRKTCHAFIHPENVDKKRAVCPKCWSTTCPKCKEPEHPGDTCTASEALKATLELLERKGWKKCPRCGHGVERESGCKHIKCRCGSHFCYTCGAILDTNGSGCACPIWDPGEEPILNINGGIFADDNMQGMGRLPQPFNQDMNRGGGAAVWIQGMGIQNAIQPIGMFPFNIPAAAVATGAFIDPRFQAVPPGHTQADNTDPSEFFPGNGRVRPAIQLAGRLPPHMEQMYGAVGAITRDPRMGQNQIGRSPLQRPRR